jgi:ADP-ribose pyrophosphatase
LNEEPGKVKPMNYQDLLKKNPNIFSNENAILKIITDKDTIKNWQVERKRQLLDKGLPENWAKIGIVYEDPYIVIIRDLGRFPSGILGSYFRVFNSADLRGGQATVVIPIVNDLILLMRQFRHPTRKWHWEVPRGFGEPGIPAEENARKEVLEEINGKILELINLGPYNSNTGIEGANVQLFLARMESTEETNLEEGIESYKLFEIHQVEEMIRDAEITDGFTIAAFFRARLKHLI